MEKLYFLFLFTCSPFVNAQTPVLYMSEDTICKNHAVIYSDSTVTTKPSTYQWIFTGATSIVPCTGCVISGDTVTVVLSTSTTPYPPSIHAVYTINSSMSPGGCFPVKEKITNVNGSDSVTKCLTVLSNPLANYTLQKDTNAVSTWNIYPHYTFFYPADSMKWSWGDGTSTTAFYPSHTYSAPGWYNICLYTYSRHFCSTTSCMNDTIYRADASNSLVYVNVIDPASGIKKINYRVSVDVFPNPANNIFTVKTNDAARQLIHVYDSNGNLVLTRNFQKDEVVDVSHLPEGVYALSVSSPSHISTKKVVILR